MKLDVSENFRSWERSHWTSIRKHTLGEWFYHESLDKEPLHFEDESMLRAYVALEFSQDKYQGFASNIHYCRTNNFVCLVLEREWKTQVLKMTFNKVEIWHNLMLLLKTTFNRFENDIT